MWLPFNECELESNFKQWLNGCWPLTVLGSYNIVNSSSNNLIHPFFFSFFWITTVKKILGPLDFVLNTLINPVPALSLISYLSAFFSMCMHLHMAWTSGVRGSQIHPKSGHRCFLMLVFIGSNGDVHNYKYWAALCMARIRVSSVVHTIARTIDWSLQWAVATFFQQFFLDTVSDLFGICAPQCEGWCYVRTFNWQTVQSFSFIYTIINGINVFLNFWGKLPLFYLCLMRNWIRDN